jgi:hypothetical protein
VVFTVHSHADPCLLLNRQYECRVIDPSRQRRAQLYNRLLPLLEFQYSLSCTARHIPGSKPSWQMRVPEPGLPIIRCMFCELTYVAVGRKYRSHWQQWYQFCRVMRWSEWLEGDQHASNTKLGLFAIYCWRYGWRRGRPGNEYGTIQLKRSSIRWYHRMYLDLALDATPSFQLLMRASNGCPLPYARSSLSARPFFGCFTTRSTLASLAAGSYGAPCC